MSRLPKHNRLRRYLSDDIEQRIPDELRVLDSWITWEAGGPDLHGKFAKFPKGRDGKGCRWQSREQQMTFSEALENVRRKGHSGIGLVLPARAASGRHVVALDFDDVNLDAPEELRYQEIRSLHKRLGEPYLEKSPSGKGLRMFIQSDQPVPQVSVANPLGGKDELFCASVKWVTVTGDQVMGAGVPNMTDEVVELAALFKTRSGQKLQHSKSTPVGNSSTRPPSGWNGWPPTKIRDGEGREEFMLSYAGYLRARGFTQTDIEQECLTANKTYYEDQLDEAVVLDRARRYANRTGTSPDSVGNLLERVDQTDAGNVALLYELTQGNNRYIPEMDQWIFWDGNRWNADPTRSELHLQRLRVAESHQEQTRQIEKALNGPDLSDAQRQLQRDALKGIKKWVAKCRDLPRLNAMTSLAEKDPRFILSAGQLDRDPNLLGVANGVVDLRNGTLRPDGKSDYILRRTSVAFNPDAPTDSIRSFIEEITSSADHVENGRVQPTTRPGLALHLQKVVGYCLTGLVHEQVMFMLAGKGSNGKSLLVDLMKYVMADYCEVLPPEILLTTKSAKNAEQASPVTRMLCGARAVVTSESKEGAQLDAAVVKRHTGDSKMTARGLFEHPITFDVTHKLLLLTNHPPQVDHMDEALKGRLQVIPFDMSWNRPGTVNPDSGLPDADKGLLSRLKRESEGVLKFFIEGAVLYYKEGLIPPKEVAAFTHGYLAEQDTISRWLAEACIPCSLTEGLTTAMLHESYLAFCRSEGDHIQAPTPVALGRRLQRMGYSSTHSRTGKRYPLKLDDAVGVARMRQY